MKRIIFLLIFIVSLLLSIKYHYGNIDFLLLVIQLVFFRVYFKSIRKYQNHLFVLFMLFYLFCSIHIVALFQLTSSGFFKSTISYGEYTQLAKWGNDLFFIIATVLFFFRGKETITTQIGGNIEVYRCDNSHIEKVTMLFLLFVIFLQFFSMSIGIVSNQQDATLVLPFHLNGIIDEIRSTICQFIFCIYLYDRFSKNQSVDKKIVLVFFLYAIIEIFLKNSKGALLFSFMPVLVLMFIMGKIDRKSVTKYVIPLIVFVAFSYTVIEVARQEGQITIGSLVEASKNTKSMDEEEKSSPYIRAFLTGVYYTKTIDYISSDRLEFDFRNVPMLIALRGGAPYMTRVIDGMPETVHHSSGVTGMCDALLWGGYPMCYIVMTVLTLLAIWGDKARIFIKKPLYRLIFFLWFYNFFTGTTISYIIDPMFLSSIGSIIIRVFLTKYYYFKYGKPTKVVRLLSNN